MEVKINLVTNKSKVVKYLTRKEAWSYGFIRYNQLKKMISHITKINSNYEIRRLFLYLVEEGIFIKKKIVLDPICISLKIQTHHVLKIKL